MSVKAIVYIVEHENGPVAIPTLKEARELAAKGKYPIRKVTAEARTIAHLVCNVHGGHWATEQEDVT